MAKIHYFQRYSSLENTVTNNFLHLLARICAYSSEKASQLITEIAGCSVDIGVEMSQQTKDVVSIPDGALVQRSFKILVEAKVDAAVDIGQLVNHSKGFSGESKRILLLLAKQEITSEIQSRIRARIHAENPGVIFQCTTYERVCNSISHLFYAHEESMVSLCTDFIEYCNDTGLFDQSRYFMRIVPCGKSVEINSRYGVYFHPSYRGYTKHSYVGIYALKSVRSIWKIDCIYDVTLEGGVLTKILVEGMDTDEYDDKIRSTINDALVECGYEIGSGHRFFCGHAVKTDYRKTSYGGIQGARFENIKNVLGGMPENTEDIAQRLKAITWQ